MAITDKTRKTLWARQGNRCSMCRTELVSERNEHDRKWIRTVIDNAKNKVKMNKPKLLPRLTNGKQIVDILRDVYA